MAIKHMRLYVNAVQGDARKEEVQDGDDINDIKVCK